jgi:gluconokinase
VSTLVAMSARRPTPRRGGGGPLVVAIDVGSSSVRAGLFRRDATPVPRTFVQVPYQPDVDGGGGVSVEFGRLFEVVGQTLDAFVAAAGGRLGDVVAVGTSCFLHSLAALDRGGRPISPLLTWADTTSASKADQLRGTLDPAVIWQESGAPLHPSYWPAKILALRERVGSGAARWAGAPELLFGELTGQRAIDVSHASGTGLLDRRTAAWHATLLEALPVDAAALPTIARRSASARLSGPAARRWPALARATWFVPWSDAVCGNVGLGCLAGGPTALQIGTSGAIRAIVADPTPTLPIGLFSHRLSDGTALLGGQLSEGGGVAAATARLLGRSMRSLEAAAGPLPPASHGLSVLPYLAGERGPGYHAAARGVVAGLGLTTRPEEVFRAVIESIALDFAALDRRLATVLGERRRVVASGGALARSTLLAGVLAAALGRPIEVSADAEASTRGAAALALAAAGIIGSPADLPAPATRTIEPDPPAVEAYRAAAERQADLYAHLLEER